MGSLSYFAANGLLGLTLRGDTFSSPAAVYLGWFTTPPSADGTGTEVTGGGYARQAVTFDPATDGNITSAAAVTWTALHSGSDQMLAGWGIWDAATAGNLLAFGRTPSLVIPLGAPVNVPAAAITISSDDAAMTDYLANAWLDHLFNNDTYINPSAVYIGHYTTTPTASTAGAEVADPGYDRQSAAWASPAVGASLLDAAVTWTPLATDDPQTLDGWALADANSAGNVLWFYQWPTPVDVPAGDTIELSAGMFALRAA